MKLRIDSNNFRLILQVIQSEKYEKEYEKKELSKAMSFSSILILEQ